MKPKKMNPSIRTFLARSIMLFQFHIFLDFPELGLLAVSKISLATSNPSSGKVVTTSKPMFSDKQKKKNRMVKLILSSRIAIKFTSCTVHRVNGDNGNVPLIYCQLQHRTIFSKKDPTILLNK